MIPSGIEKGRPADPDVLFSFVWEMLLDQAA